MYKPQDDKKMNQNNSLHDIIDFEKVRSMRNKSIQDKFVKNYM